MSQDSPKRRTRGTGVYRMYDADGVLLYVGMGHAIARAYQHRMDSPWFLQVARIDIEHYPSSEEARRAEVIQTQALNPKYNKDRGQSLIDIVRTMPTPVPLIYKENQP